MPTVKQFQKGGKQEKPLDTGHYNTTTGKVVVWGTPEYEKAYHRGEVVTDKGVKSPVTIQGGELDEVVVKNNYKRGFWEKYKDKIIEENKDAGVLGAAVGTPISAVASLPQLAMMEGLTGKVQRPSEAMNIQNPYGAMVVDAVTDPANLIGAGVLTKEKVLAGLARSTEDGILSNAHKLNPFAFKPNPEAYYRMIGDEGLADLQNVGYVRSNPNTFYKDKHPFFSKGYPIDGRIGKSVVEDSKYLGNNMIEVGGNNEIGNRFVKNRWADAAPDPNIFVARDKIGIDNPNLKIYKKDWLQGYKQIEVPQNFKSEINWGQWNKEIPNNPQLMQEYNAIEQTSKANGSWMKNPDGSVFKGTPEQFVQQNSENFKKAFSGKVSKQYHTTDKNFEVFDTTKSPSKGIFFTPDKEYAEKFTKIYKPSDEVSNTGEYYLNVNKPLNVDDPISHTTVSHYYNQRPFTAGNYDAIQGKEMDILGGKSDIDVTTVFSPNQVKSAVGNNGMFDMNNPNIYKSIVPIAGASYLATQEQPQYKNGGKHTNSEQNFLKDYLKDGGQKTDKERQAHAFFISKGWKPEQAIGIVGNLKHESNFDTTVLGTADDKGSRAIAQWHGDRLKMLKNKYGENWTDFKNQLEFVDWELRNTHKTAGDKLRNSKGVWEAGRIVSDDYEIPKVKFNADERRQRNVADLAMKFKGIKLTPEDNLNYGVTFENSVAPYMYTPPPFTTIQIPEMQTQQVSYLDTPQETTNLAEETEAKPSKINPQEEAFMQDLLSQMAEGVGYVEPEKSAVFQVGGTKKPIYVSDKNDPKYTAYQDSLKLYNKYDIKNKQFENITNKNNIKTAKTYADDFLELENNKIAPIGTNTMMARYGTDNIINKQDKEFSKKDSQILRDAQDRLAGEYSIRGRIPIYKKPTQPIQVLQKAEIPTINLIQSNLQHQGIIEPDFELEASTDIRVPYRTPKYYDIQDNSNPNAGFGDGYGGNQSNYRSFDPSKLPPADNRTITPRYQEGGQIPISPEGMYAYPNQPVIIPSSRITMKNIPHSILAVTDQGDRQILQPEKEYQLKGNNTLEIPLTKAEENFLKDLYETHKK